MISTFVQSNAYYTILKVCREAELKMRFKWLYYLVSYCRD